MTLSDTAVAALRRKFDKSSTDEILQALEEIEQPDEERDEPEDLGGPDHAKGYCAIVKAATKCATHDAGSKLGESASAFLTAEFKRWTG